MGTSWHVLGQKIDMVLSGDLLFRGINNAKGLRVVRAP
jgi:hypothetical protein